MVEPYDSSLPLRVSLLHPLSISSPRLEHSKRKGNKRESRARPAYVRERPMRDRLRERDRNPVGDFLEEAWVASNAGGLIVD